MALETVSNQSPGCPHGSGTAAACAQCRELQQLIEAQRRDAGSGGDRRAVRVWGDDAWGAGEAARGTAVLEQARSVFTEGQRQRGPSGTVAESLKQDILTAVGIGLLTPLQGTLLTTRLALVAEGTRGSWRAMGRRCHCSHHTAKRQYLRAVAVTCANGRGWATERRTVVRRERGERRREVWNRQTDRFGQWSQTWGERVTDRRQRAAALAAPRRDDEITTAIRSSAMNVLFGALIGAVATPAIRAQGPVRRLIESPDWAQNLQWAQRRLRRAQRGAIGPNPSASEVYAALARGCPLCGSCHTPILVGSCVNGTRIYRNKKYCDDACKLRYHRRQHGRWSRNHRRAI